jgi:CheY-like chemotaxis protein
MIDQQPLADSHRSMEILLLEDNPADTYLLLSVLQSLSARLHVTAVDSGAQALDLLFQRGRYAKSLRPDLIVLDLNVPILNGHEVLNVIKSNSVLRSIPVLVWSASAQPHDVKRAYDRVSGETDGIGANGVDAYWVSCILD